MTVVIIYDGNHLYDTPNEITLVYWYLLTNLNKMIINMCQYMSLKN